MCFKEGNHRGKVPFPTHLKSIYHFDHLAKVCFSGFSTIKLLFCLFILYSSEGSFYVQFTMLWEVMFLLHFWTEKWQFCTRDCFSPPFISLFNHSLYQCRLVDVYVILWVILCYYFISLLKLCQLWSLWSYFVWLLCLFNTFPNCVWFVSYFVLFLSISLLSSAASFSRLISCFSYPSPRISHLLKQPWFLLLENNIKNQNRGSQHICCH